MDINSLESVEHAPMRARFGDWTRTCIYCGGKTRRQIKSYYKKLYGERHYYRYCCPTCGKETSPFTQIDFEDNEKRFIKIYNILLKYVKPEQIKRVWIDKDGTVWDKMPALEVIKKMMYYVTVDGRQIEIPCSHTALLDYYETPIGIDQDKKGTKKAIAELKKLAAARSQKTEK